MVTLRVLLGLTSPANINTDANTEHAQGLPSLVSHKDKKIKTYCHVEDV